MRYEPIKRWDEILPGDVIVDLSGVPRTVMIIGPPDSNDIRSVSCEGVPSFAVHNGHIIQTITLDELDAILTLHAAGLNPIPIQE